jgi:hypothetical protein
MKPVSRPTTKKLSRTTSRNSPLAIHGTLEFACTVLAACPVSVCVSPFIGARSLGEVRNSGDSATLGAELRVK